MPTFPLESIGVGSQLYTAAPGIEIGTRLNGGHFRDTVEQGVVTDHGSILEIAWELVRMREFPSRPCRFDALFLWPDEVRARGWHYRQGFFDSETSSQRGLYQIEVERICQIWATDMHLISYIRDGETVGELMRRARQYWESVPSKSHPEILLHGQVRVRKNLRELGIEQIVPIQIPQCRLFTFSETTLGADSRVGAPAVEGGVRLLRQPVAGVAPELFPHRWIAQDAFWVRSTAGDKAGEDIATGGLADGIVAQVEAPAHVVAVVGQRAVDGVAGEEEHVAGLHRHRHSRFHIHKLLGDAQAAGMAGAVGVQARAMALGHNLQTAVFERRLIEWKPHRQHLGRIGFGQNHAAILVPVGGADQRLAVVVFGH